MNTYRVKLPPTSSYPIPRSISVKAISYVVLDNGDLLFSDGKQRISQFATGVWESVTLTKEGKPSK